MQGPKRTALDRAIDRERALMSAIVGIQAKCIRERWTYRQWATAVDAWRARPEWAKLPQYLKARLDGAAFALLLSIQASHVEWRIWIGGRLLTPAEREAAGLSVRDVDIDRSTHTWIGHPECPWGARSTLAVPNG